MDNLKYYEQGRSVPKEAQKVIGGGRLQGFTDINSMWRIKKLTEMFGAAGVGWWYTIDKQWLETAPNGEIKAFCNITLYYKDPETGEESKGIPGHGGNSFISKEKKGDYVDDECYKKALTDAISIAAKALGIGADIYFAEDRTKYDKREEEPSKETPKKITPTPKKSEENDEKITKGVEAIAKVVEELKEIGVDKTIIADAIKKHYSVNGKPSANYSKIKDVELLKTVYQELTEIKKGLE